MDLFRVPPSSESARKKFLKWYHDYIDGYNRWWRASVNFKDILDADKLPVDFMELAGTLWYKWQNILNAWLFVFDIIKEKTSITLPESKKTYVSEVLRQDIGGQIMRTLDNYKSSNEDMNMIASYMEDLLKALNWKLPGYNRDDPVKKRIDSLYIRLWNAIFINKNKGDYNKLKEAMNLLEWKIRDIKE